MNEVNKTEPTLTLLSVLRLAAAFLIFQHHFYFYEQGAYPYVTTRYYEILFSEGHIGVVIFFTLSGFLLMYRHGELRHTRQILMFYKKRLARLILPYWIVFLLTFLHASRMPVPDDIYAGLLLHSIFPNAGFRVIVIGWALSAELFFYICFPLIARLFQLSHQYTGRFAWFLSAICGCCIEILFRNVVDQLDSNTPSSIHYWRYHTFWGMFAAFYTGAFAGRMFLAYYEKKSRQDNQIPGDAIANFFSITARTSRVISPIILFLLCASWYHHFGGYSYPKSSLIDYLSIASAAWLAYELAKISPNAVSRSVIFQISLGSYEFLILHASLLLAPVFTIIQDNVSAVRSAYLIVCILLASALRLMSVWISKAIGNFTRMFLNIQKNRGATP